MKEAAESGGGPAGVVDGFSAMNEGVDFPLDSCDFASGVEGGLEEKDKWKVDIVAETKHSDAQCCAVLV